MNNWLWIALGIGALALFAFGRGGCGMGHGGHGRGHRDEGSPDREREPTSGALSTPAKADVTTPTALTAEHAHGTPLASQGALEHAGHGSAPQQAESRRHRHGC